MTARLLITCRQMQVSMHLFEDQLRARNIEWECPAIPGQQFSGDQLAEFIGEFDAIIAGDDQVNEVALQAGLPRLKTVAKWGIGIDGIDLDAAARLGIKVTNTPGMFDDEVADVAFGYLLSLVRGLHEIDRAVRSGNWLKIAGRSTRGMTLGVFGLGGTGRAMAARGLALGMRVIGTEEQPAAIELAKQMGVEVVPFDALLAESEVISLHCPLTPTTEGLFGAKAFAAMRDGSYFINTSRGRVHDEAAVIDALKSGKLAGAGLDVFEVEPLPTTSPLLAFDNVIVGAHNASNTQEAVIRTSGAALANALAALGLE